MDPCSDYPHAGPLVEFDAVVHRSQTEEDTLSLPKESLCSQTQEQEISKGMSFESLDAVKSFYRDYGVRKGFGFMVRNSRKGPDGKINYIILACSREGSYVSPIPTELKTNSTIKNNCPAKISAKLSKDDGRWYIYTVDLDHCHELSPGKARLFHARRNISPPMKRTLETTDEAGVRVNKSFRSLVQGSGGYENLAFGEQDVHDFVGQQRRALGKEGDGKALIAYFAQMQQKNSDFYYEIDLDDNFHVKNIFWADARSRAMCEYFGDVVSFDTTYLVNKYDMPLALFVGVNHHGQSILLGCGLLSVEDTDSFVWLFETWMRCMYGKAPQGIVTDQCMAMENAIHLVFPNARHRWCLWHIMKKIPEKFKGYGQYKEMKNDMEVVVYDSLDEIEFDSTWNTFIDKYGLRDNEWLTNLYLERSRWVPCLVRKYFWAGISTTQRSESMNVFFDGYVNSKTSIQQFVLQYGNAIRDMAEKECKADFQSFNTKVPCATNSDIERQFQQQYTHKKFNEVQAEFRGKMNCCVIGMCEDGSICRYEVMEEMCIAGHTKEVNFHVIFNRDTHDLSCTCLLFEFKGIMCRHSFIIFAKERVKQIPSKYILDRWSKNLRRNHTSVKCSYDLKHMQPQVERFDQLCKVFHKVAEIASVSPQATELLAEIVHGAEEKVKTAATSSQNPGPHTNDM
ncbi:protein FAR-RED IMPAIRED RESPONSE 1-like [Lotus japonicus]|uniref:protein FAR-RED IMPAIRED RESPONSE 1-like n=1 Tax=Lotus japonicus TaxID=34305 RepID=UPI002582B853|nr:protein FAR-RED IMPAIRED RESPONSE 1-like [Lotus japonicus]